MACADNEVEGQLLDVGKRLASPPTNVGELLSLLDQTERFLSRVQQSPRQSMLDALRPTKRLLAEKRFLGHSDEDVKVAVASCISEITRITAPDAPYDDDLMKEVFQNMVDAFAKLDDISSLSFSKRVSILETVAKVRSCLVMLDLECDALILNMFHIFLRTIRPNHSENIFSSMGAIMTVVLEESEDISPELISCLLDAVKTDNKDILPIARRLGERVIAECALKLKPYLVKSAKSNKAFLGEYSEVVAFICEGKDCVEQSGINPAVDVMFQSWFQVPLGPVHTGLSLPIWPNPGNGTENPADDSKLSERTVSDELPQMGNGELALAPSSQRQKLRCSHHGNQSQNKHAANRGGSDGSDLKAGKPDNVSDPKVKKLSNRQAAASVHFQGSADHYGNDGSLGKEAESSSKNEPQPPSESDGETVDTASLNPVDSFDTSRSKRGWTCGSRLSAKQCGDNGKVQPEEADGVEKLTIVTCDSKTQMKKLTGRKGKVTRGSSEKQQITIKHLGKLNSEGDMDGKMGLKSSERPAHVRELDQRIVGVKIKVWWPDDKMFYDGTVADYDHMTKKHKILYDDGDVEVLLLKEERWEFIEEQPPSKRTKKSSNHAVREANVETPITSGSRSTGAGSMELPKRRGRPPKGGSSNRGLLSSNDSPNILSKWKERVSSKSKDGIPKTDTKLKDGEKLKEDASKAEERSSRSDGKLKDDPHKSSRRFMDDSPKTVNKAKDDAVGAGSQSRKDKLNEETHGLKASGESKTNGVPVTRKLKTQEAEASSAKEKSVSSKEAESEASAVKKRKIKGNS